MQREAMGKTVVVAGAGPVGALAAIFLAQRGYDVKVFDKRSLPDRKPAVDDRKAYLLNLNNGSMRAFKTANVNLDDIIKTHNGAVEMVIKRADGSVRQSIKMPVPAKDPQMLRVYRDEISRHLIDEAKRLYPEAISFAFDSPLVSVDFVNQIAEFAPKGKTLSQVHFDLLVGADGAGSTVREQLSAVLSEGFIERWTHDIVYSTGPLRDVEPGDFPGHTFMEMHAAKEGTAMLYARGDGDKRVGLFTAQSEADRLMAGDVDWLLDVLEQRLVGMKSSVKRGLKELISARPKFQKMSGWMYLSQLHGPKTVLIGDAAHTMTPVLGQGCNSGLEDVRIFAETLDRLDGDIDAALPAFTAARLPEIRALIELNEMAAEERVQVKTSPSVFKRPALQRAQMGELKFRDVKPALYMDLALVTGVVSAFAFLIGGYVSKLNC